jgi:hypothetical protein
MICTSPNFPNTLSRIPLSGIIRQEDVCKYISTVSPSSLHVNWQCCTNNKEWIPYPRVELQAGQTFHFFTLLSAFSLSPDCSLFLLVDLVANGTAPRITELSDIIFKVLILRLGPSEVLIEFKGYKFEIWNILYPQVQSSLTHFPHTLPFFNVLSKIHKLLAFPYHPHLLHQLQQHSFFFRIINECLPCFPCLVPF